MIGDQHLKFTYEAYRNLIKRIKENYTIATYHNWQDYSNPCILRHDVDMDLDKAVEFAEFENFSCGKVCSAYFILISSDFYNVFSKENQRRIKRIAALGHEIGLHFDEVKYEGLPPDKIIDKIKIEAKLLGGVLGMEIRAVSMHRPSRQIMEANLEVDGLINSYQKKFFKEFKYLSDSRMHWREDVEKIVDRKEFPMLHILTHPFWYSKEEESTREKLLRFCKEKQYAAYRNLNDNFRDLEEFLCAADLERGM